MFWDHIVKWFDSKLSIEWLKCRLIRIKYLCLERGAMRGVKHQKDPPFCPLLINALSLFNIFIYGYYAFVMFFLEGQWTEKIGEKHRNFPQKWKNIIIIMLALKSIEIGKKKWTQQQQHKSIKAPPQFCVI